MFRKKQKFISLKEAAKLTGYAPDYIGSLIRKGKLTGKKVYSGVSWMTAEEDIKKYQEKIETQKLKANKKWRVFKFVSDFFPPIRIPVRVKETTKRIVGIQDYNTKRAKIFAFSWRGILIVLVLLSFIGIGPSKIWQKLVAAFTGEEKTINLYSTTCTGEWQNPQNSQGQPEAGELGDLNSFSESNSAVYKGGPLNLFCQNFENSSEQPTGEEFKNLKIQSAKINFSFAIGEKKPDLEINQAPATEEPAPVPEEPELPVEEPTVPTEEPAPAIEEPIIPTEEPGEIQEPSVPIEEPGEIEITPETILPLELMNGSDSEVPSTETADQPSGFLNKVKKLFGIKTVRAQEEDAVSLENEIPPIETVSPPTDAITPPTEVSDNPIKEISTPNLDSKILIWYSLDNETWWQLADVSQQPVSNFLNGGYFSFEAPFLKSFDDVKNIKIKFEGVIGGETNFVAYLDSVWVEVVYEPEKKNEPKMDDSETELKEIKKIQISDNSLIIPDLQNDFSSNDEPSFIVSEPEIKTEDIISGGKGRLISGVETIQETYGTGGELISNEEYFLASIESNYQELTSSSKEKNQKDSISVQIFGFNGTKTDILPEIQPIFKDGKESFEIKFTKEKIREFKPGLYKLKIKLETADSIFFLEQDFSWGVLAINTSKSIYSPGEKAYLQMAVLRDDGYTACDASLQLEIRNPKSETTILSTEDGTIEYSNECGLNNVTNVPDYFTYYEVDDTGSYEMKLKNLDTGYEIKDSFEVRESLPFDIERMGPTRINPTAEYEMTFKIKANQDFSGEVIEKVPASFSISEQEGMRQEINGEEKSLIWKADWKEGEIYELTYQFDAPDISPYLYLLGPLETGQFKETRQWQIASDRTTWTEACGTATKSACTCSGGPKKCGGLGQCSYVCPDYTAYHVQAAVNTCSYTKTGTCGTASCTLASQCLANFTCTYSSGNCSYTCSTNYEDCDLSSANGCECDLTANTCVGTTCTPAGITVSGTVYADEASTVWPHCDSSTANISLAVNGVVVQTTHCHTSPDGTYSFTSVTVAANQEVAVFMNATDKGIAATVAKDASTTPITLNPREGRVWVKEETGAANITNTLLHKSDKAVASCGNVPYTISDVTNALTVDDTYKIVIETGKTFAPDGNVTTPAMEITGTYTASSYTLILSAAGTVTTPCTGDAGSVMPLCVAGTFTANASTVKYTGDGDTNITAATYNNLEFSPTITDNRIYTGAGAITVGGTLNINPNATAKYLMFYLGGTTSVTGAITIQRTGTANSYLDTTVAGHYSLTASSISIQTACTLLANSSTITLTASSGQPLTESGSGYFDDGTSNVVFTGDGNVTIGDIDAGVEYYDLTFSPTITANRIYSSNGNIEIGHNLDINPDASSAYSLTFNLGGYFYASSETITIQRTNSATSVLDTTITGYSLNASVINIQAGGTLAANGSIITIGGASGTPFTVNGTFNYDTSTVLFNGNGDITIAATTYYTLKFGPALGLSTNRTYTGGGAITVNNNMEIYPTGSGTESLTFNLGGTTSITGSLTIRRAGSVTSILNTTISNHSLTVGSLSIWIGGTLTGNASPLDSNGDVTIDSGGTLTSTSVNFNVGGSWSNSASGVFAHSNGTVIFDAVTTGKTISDGGDPFYIIQFTGGSGGWTYTDGCSSGPHQVIVNAASGTANFINAKTGDGSHDPTVTTGTLNVDWYLGVHVADAAVTTTHIGTGVADITISENSSSSWLSGWDKRVKITTDQTDIDADLTNFPVLVYLSTSSGKNDDDVSAVFDELQSDDNRKKIAVTKSDGTTELYVEIEKWDDANEKAWLWVSKSDWVVSGTTDTDFYLYYDADHADNTTYVGDPNSTPAETVWDTDFEGVWHLSEDPSGTAPQMKDSTAGSNDGTSAGTMTSEDQIAAKINGGLDFDGSNDEIVIGDLDLTTHFTISFWMKADAIGSWMSTVMKSYDYGLQINTAGVIRANINEGTWASTKGPSASIAALTWYHISWVWDETNNDSILYVDGSYSDTETTYNNHVSNNNTLRFGLWDHADWEGFNGVIDEVHISNSIRPVAWIKASYETGRDDLLDFGTEETGGGAAATVWRYNSDWGSGASSKTTGTDSNGDNPQPISAGAIRIREYSNTSGAPTYYLYNLKINWVTQTGTNYGEYDYYADYGSNYLTSTANSGANKDAVIGVGWYRATVGTMNAVGTINEPPTNGSWYVGMLTGLSVSINSYSVNLGAITPGAAPTDGTNVLTITTSATNGYVVTAWSNQAMTCSNVGACGSETISDWTGTNASPTTWSSGSYGFGYSTNDYALLTGTADRFSGPKFAAFSHSGSGDLIADRSSTECPCSSQTNTITYRIAASPTQRAGPYSTTIIYIVTAQY